MNTVAGWGVCLVFILAGAFIVEDGVKVYPFDILPSVLALFFLVWNGSKQGPSIVYRTNIATFADMDTREAYLMKFPKGLRDRLAREAGKRRWPLRTYLLHLVETHQERNFDKLTAKKVKL